MDTATRRDRTSRKDNKLVQDSETHPIQRWVASDVASKPVLKTQYVPNHTVKGQSTVLEPDAIAPNTQPMPGRPLDWPGFASDMPSAVSKELLTDWRYDC